MHLHQTLAQKVYRLAGVQSAATSTITTDAIDMAQDGGWESVRVVATLGTAGVNTGTANTLHLTQCDTSGGTYAKLAGTTATSADGTVVTLSAEVYRPQERYLKAVLTRGTSTTIENVVVILSGGRSQPVVHPATVSAVVASEPAETT